MNSMHTFINKIIHLHIQTKIYLKINYLKSIIV